MGKKKNMPLTKGVARVPVIMQLEALECGAASLAMVMAYYGKWVPLEQVRTDCGVSRDGSNAKNIYLAAENYGFDVEAYRMSPEELREGGRFPCIIHWNMNHFLVLDGFKGNKVYLNDPARGALKVTWEEFDRSFTGVTLIPVPSENFEPEGRPKSTLAFAMKRLAGAGAAVVFVMLVTAISYLFGIVNSVNSRIFMDRILSGLNGDWLYPFIYLLILLAVLQLMAAWARAIYSLKINGKMAVVGSSSYMWKVLHLPMEFFSQRLAGDIQSRLELNAEIAGTLVNTFAPLLLNTAMMVFYLLLMIRQSLLLTAVGLTALLLNMVLSAVISKKRINITRVQMRDAGKLDAATVTGISMIETIKASGAENGFFQKWAGYQASVNAAVVRGERTNQILGAIPAFLAMLANYTVLILGILLTMKGRFSLGAVLMFQGFLTSFMEPAMTMVEAGQTIQEMRTQMERVEDVMDYPEDPVFSGKPAGNKTVAERLAGNKNVVDKVAGNEAVADRLAGDKTVADKVAGNKTVAERLAESTIRTGGLPVNAELKKLGGNVELKHISFGYSRLAPPLIEDFSLSLKSGQRVALVGPSGCGKSTISRLLSGLYQPWSGEILFDGKAPVAYPRDVLTGSLAVVDQDIILFSDTVANNIKMWDESIQDFEMILAARDAQIHEDIMALPGGYRHRLTNGGKNLSGGQRQRLEIARVLAQDPTIIILDEATSALDARTEYELVNAIRDRGITCMIIAHRLSTVRDCDEILVMDQGRVVERGRHEDLMKKGGAYADLVTSE